MSHLIHPSVKTELILNLYLSVLPLLKNYVVICDKRASSTQANGTTQKSYEKISGLYSETRGYAASLVEGVEINTSISGK